MSYERTDASFRLIAISAALLVLWVALSLGGAAWMYRAHYDVPASPGRWMRQASFTNGPKVKTSITLDWAELNQATNRHLDEYAWVDRQSGIAQIPIDRAMDWIAAHGVGAAHEEPAPSSVRTEAPHDREGTRK